MLLICPDANWALTRPEPGSLVLGQRDVPSFSHSQQSGHYMAPLLPADELP